ncbi:hypothetical protein NBRGN_002_00140 [Nocardia brasiliensis NBRC 14402]|nr:hypothetical protein NBRGN_002_00140 [Nocardia brasiliensis NBRC 14402]
MHRDFLWPGLIARNLLPIRDRGRNELGGTLDRCRCASPWKENSDTRQFDTSYRPTDEMFPELSPDRSRVHEARVTSGGVVTFAVGIGGIRQADRPGSIRAAGGWLRQA